MPDLRAGAAYRSLMNVGRTECVSTRLVAPGSPETSYLVDKLRGSGTGCFVGSGMPPGSPLGDAERTVITTWIRQGALDN